MQSRRNCSLKTRLAGELRWLSKVLRHVADAEAASRIQARCRVMTLCTLDKASAHAEDASAGGCPDDLQKSCVAEPEYSEQPAKWCLACASRAHVILGMR